MTWGAFLAAMAGPLAKQVLMALGFGVVTFIGVDLALDSLLSVARAAWSGSLSADVAAYVAMAGINTGLSIIAGAMVGRVTMLATKHLRMF